MHDELTYGSGLSPVELDERNRNDVLQHLLLEYPTPFSVDELVAELTSPDDGFAERDGYLNAVRDLRRVGLVHLHGEFVWASRAAKSAWVLKTV
jgi:hypothetical protein